MSEIEKISQQIEVIKKEIFELGDLRPGSVTKQYSDPENKKRPFYQINYTIEGKFKTGYVRKAFADEMKEQTLEYKKLKKLLAEWMELGIKKSKIMMKDK
ncbi:MAG: hypothetical protein KAH13_02480 [Tenericutes bacterium]|nr:hypothetical protein [Mycoplasmatota bacterium]